MLLVNKVVVSGAMESNVSAHHSKSKEAGILIYTSEQTPSYKVPLLL